MKRVLWMGLAMVLGTSAGWAGEIGFEEDYALATDRQAALKQLIPGTEDYYYWNCVQLLNTQQFDQIEQLLQPWVQRHGETPRVWEIRTRRALLTYDRDPQQTLSYLRQRFNINYPHRKEELNADPDLPTQLDPQLISRDQFRKQALLRHGNSLNGFEDSALEWLVGSELNPDQRREMLSRLSRPDYPNLPRMVADDLNYAKSRGFGSHAIHRQLLKTQLDELLQLKPDLLNQQQFVRAYLTKLQPNPDVDWRHSPEELARFLERMQDFAERLAPVHNSLKAHVLYHRLVLARSQGRYDKDLFLSYLKLPRATAYISRALRESSELKQFACDLNSNYDGVTLLSPIGNDEPLVRSYLGHFLVDAGDTKEFEPFVNDVYLRHLFAETKIVNGLGEPEQWASLLPPEPFRQLRERVDIDFDYGNQTQFAAGDPVSLELHVKNVSTLIVKVFEINTQNFYRENSREIDTDINLDGLVANVEQTYQYNDPPLRRVKRKFDFPMLNRTGVYVIDFIGNGQSSRALIRKGQLRHLVQTTPAGQSFTILDEAGQQVSDATVWLAGHAYQAGPDGTISVPFSTSPGRQAIVITAPCPGAPDATYSALTYFKHEPETYQFRAGIYVDREALLQGKKAQVLIRPGLDVNGTPVSLQLLEDVKLTLTATDLDGTASAVEIPDFKLFEDRESVHEFQVPPRLANLDVRLTAKIKLMTTGSKIDVAAQAAFALNFIDRTEKIEDLHLLQADGQYVLELRGRTGEPRVSRPVVLQIKHRDFKDTVNAIVKSDTAGRIHLGALDAIFTLTARGPEGTEHTWTLVGDRHTYSQIVHGHVGKPIVLPYLGQAPQATRGELSLLALTGGTFAVDCFEHVSVRDGLVVLSDLPAGDYDLWLKATNTRVSVRVTDGKPIGNFLIGALRQLETKPLPPLQIASIVAGDDTLTIQLQNASKFARVHVLATRYVPEYDAFAQLSQVRGVEPYMFRQTPGESVYLTGRNIGDEYRYIIDRKYASKYPGNMLPRPSLLLNPWAVRDTETGEQQAAQGGEFGGVGAAPSAAAARPAAEPESAAAAADHFADLNFLAGATAVQLNLVPDDQGRIELPRAQLGEHQDLRVVAVDPLSTTCRDLTLADRDTVVADLRLRNGLDPQQHFTQQKQVSIVPVGQTFTLHDITTAKFESYDTLGRVYALYATLNPDPKLAEFSFILDWPRLEPARKRELYSKYASHELSFFLFKKDPDFFQTVVRPYLANKLHKTFMDHFLLEADLTEYLLPWKYGQLNVVEQILLAQRIPGEQPHTARHVGDRYALLPPDVERFNMLFDTAVLGSALTTDDTLGLGEARKKAVQRMDQVQLRAADAPTAGAFAAPAPPAPAAAAGRGGALGRTALKRSAGRELQEMDKAGKSVRARDGATRSLSVLDDREKSAVVQEKLKEVEELARLDFFNRNALAERKLARQLYRKPDKTREWAENNYHHLTIDLQTADLVSVNAFWRDFAAHDPTTPFLSRNLAEASRNFPEMLLALAVLDLPFQAPRHDSKFADAQMTLVPGGPLVVFHEEIRPAAAPEGAATLLVSQNYFKHGDRYRTVNGEKIDKFVTGEFLIHTVYGCQIVITNPTSTRQKLNVLLQVPQGAIPVLNSKRTATLPVDLEPYHTQTLEYHFYFPAAGQFPHFPVHVAKNEQLVAAAEPTTLTVVGQPTTFDTESWDYVSQYGSLDDVLTFLDKHNIDELNLDKIAWRMHDRTPFEAVLARLVARHVYQHTLWSYALLHNTLDAAREYLQHADPIVSECGGTLRSTLLTIDPVIRKTYEHLEYKPLVNARAHALGKRRQIVNDRLHWQYHRFLKELTYERSLDDSQLLAVTYYLLVQDRIEEALATFPRIDRTKVPSQLQYDYCDAYLKFFGDQPEQARAIAARYVEHPVDRWRDTFVTIVQQLDEATGQTAATAVSEDRDRQQAQLAATEPSFNFTVEARKIAINYQNLKAVTINFYQVDVELLFSRNPFVQQFGGNFASIKPNQSLDIPLPADKQTTTIDLPEAFHTSNVLVEMVAAGETKTQPYFSNTLSVQVIENYGQIKVTQRETHQPVAKAYVKVYARAADGGVKFYKDGYTDLRGRFDYASLSTNELDNTVKFSILILSEQYGAVVQEAEPPKQ